MKPIAFWDETPYILIARCQLFEESVVSILRVKEQAVTLVLIDQSTGRHTAEDIIPRKLTGVSWKCCCSVTFFGLWLGVSFHQPTTLILSIFLLVLGIITKLAIEKIKFGD
jgi:hypothetical protein